MKSTEDAYFLAQHLTDESELVVRETYDKMIEITRHVRLSFEKIQERNERMKLADLVIKLATQAQFMREAGEERKRLKGLV